MDRDRVRTIEGCGVIAPDNWRHANALTWAHGCGSCLDLLIAGIGDSARREAVNERAAIIVKMHKALKTITMYIKEGDHYPAERMRTTAANALNELRDFEAFDLPGPKPSPSQAGCEHGDEGPHWTTESGQAVWCNKPSRRGGKK